MSEQTLELVHSYITEISSLLSNLDANTISILFLLNHSFIVSNLVYRQLDGLKRSGKIKQIPFLVGFLMVVVTGAGGAIINAVLAARPQIFFANDYLLIFLLATWILTLYFPFGLVRFISGFAPLELIAYAIEGVFVGGVVIGEVDKIAKEFPTSYFAPIIFGTISACGGGAFLRPFFLNQYVGEPVASTELSQPTIALKGSFLITTFYYVATQVIELKPFSYTLTQGQTSFRVDITPELIVRGYFVLHFLYFFYAGLVARFFSSGSKIQEKASSVAAEKPKQVESVKGTASKQTNNRKNKRD